MKKALFFLIFLIIASAAVLYFGWVRIPEGNSGVFFSTLTGYDDKTLETGNFHFRWQKLIPGTTRLYLVNTMPRTADLEVEGKLPSADLYSQTLPGNPDFSYRAVVSLTYRLDSGYILKTVSESGKSPENMEALFELTEAQITMLIKDHIEKSFADAAAQGVRASSEKMQDLLSKQALSALILESAASITISGIEVPESRLPDPDIYVSARNSYEQISSGRKKELVEAELRSARFESELEKRLGLLEKYGQLLTRYPILLEYLKINPEGDILRESDKLEEGR